MKIFSKYVGDRAVEGQSRPAVRNRITGPGGGGGAGGAANNTSGNSTAVSSSSQSGCNASLQAEEAGGVSGTGWEDRTGRTGRRTRRTSSTSP